MKKLLMLLISFTVVCSAVALVACGDKGNSVPQTCTQHVDEDFDSICDDCGDEIVVEEKEVIVTFTVKDQDEIKLANISVTLKKGKYEQSITVISGADGTFTATLTTGEYNVSYDYDIEVVGGYYQTNTSKITVGANTTALDLYLTNTTPNGTVGREFPLSVGENEITLGANVSNHYIVYRAVNLYLEIVGENVKLVYEGETHLPENGKIFVPLLGTSTNSAETLSIINLAGEEQTLIVNVTSAPGTQSNPVQLTLGEDVTTKVLAAKEDVYYTYTATAAGLLTIAVKSENSYLSITNVRNSISTNTGDDEDGIISLEVSEGDEISIVCSLLVTGEETGSVIFNATFTAAE